METESHIFQGLKRDNHEIRQKPEFLWNAHNIRLTSRDDSTSFSITNERGTKDTGITFKGHYIGHCVLDNYLIVFTHIKERAGKSVDRVYRLYVKDDSYTNIILFEGDLNFSLQHPIETLGYIEGNFIQKVYWIDGLNQPRMINIAKPELVLGEDFPIKDGLNFSNITEEDLGTNYYNIYTSKCPDGLYNGKIFDFVIDNLMICTPSIERLNGSGIFSPGVIQYAFTYNIKYGQETNIFYTSPLYYISYIDRAGSPEDKVSCQFKITLPYIDKSFDSVRVYSIHRTSISAVPNVKLVGTISTKSAELSIIDTGTIGYNVDPTLLMYMGGYDISVGTIAQKDNTLFLGNIEERNNTFLEIKDIIKKNYSIVDYNIKKEITPNSINNYYNYILNPTGKYNAYFKSGESYRLGIQAQYNNGKWSEPIFLEDKVVTEEFPWERTIGTVKSKSIVLQPNTISILSNLGVRALRTCVVFPATYERDIVCQGILSPTLFSVQGRRANSPYAQSSWFFRPARALGATADSENSLSHLYGSNIEWRHNNRLFLNNSLGCEVQNMDSSAKNIDILNTPNLDLDKFNPYYFVDENIVTLHSPDVEFDTDLQNYSWDDFELEIVGVTRLLSISGDINIKTSSTTIDNRAVGFKHNTIGWYNDKHANNGGLVSGFFYSDAYVDNIEHKPVLCRSWLIYPWHKTASINNDVNRPENKGTRSSILENKVISNLKFFDNNSSIKYQNSSVKSDRISYDITTPQIFNSNEVSLVKINTNYRIEPCNYYGNVDTLNAGSDSYFFKVGNGFGSTPDNINPEDPSKVDIDSNDPVRIKYKSSPHLVFALQNDTKWQTTDNITCPIVPLLPVLDGIPTFNGLFKMPSWWYNSIEKREDITKVDYDLLGFNIPYDVFSTINSTDIYNREVRIQSFEDYLGNELGINFQNNVGSIIIGIGIEKFDSSILNVLPKFYWEVFKIVRKSDGTFGLDIMFDLHEGAILRVTRNTIFTKDNLYLDLNDNVVGSDGAGTKIPDFLDGTSEDDYIDYGKYYTLNKGYSYYTFKKDNGAGPSNKLSMWLEKISGYGDSNEGDSLDMETIYLKKETFEAVNPTSVEIPYALIAQIKRKNLAEHHKVKFGGSNTGQNLWTPSSEPVFIRKRLSTHGPSPRQLFLEGNPTYIPFEYGDTWYTRYDCLKTYPYTEEDENSVVEIGSFMLESRVNMDGRYDRNRGMLSNLNMSPKNFNLINEVYSQKDNYFNYRILGDLYYKNYKHPSQFTWSLEKQSASDVDSWTKVTLANTYDLNSASGSLTCIKEYNDNLIAFQEGAISQIIFNPNVQIPVSEGNPIEISNNYKLQGCRVINDRVGCQNKWSITKALTGLFFIDNNSSSIYNFNGQLNDLGGKWWLQEVSTSGLWYPSSTGNGIRTFYDSSYRDIYFIPYNKKEKDALCYSEVLGGFVSQMSYGNTLGMFNIDSNFYSLRNESEEVKLYENFKGKYNNFFNEPKGWDISFISNDNPSFTKIFDTLEIKSDIYNTEGELQNYTPLNYIKVSNEYQEGESSMPDGKSWLRNKNLMKKFRIWRALIPRNNGTRERIRNPWANITLGWKPEISDSKYDKTILHDVSVKYTI